VLELERKLESYMSLANKATKDYGRLRVKLKLTDWVFNVLTACVLLSLAGPFFLPILLAVALSLSLLFVGLLGGGHLLAYFHVEYKERLRAIIKYLRRVKPTALSERDREPEEWAERPYFRIAPIAPHPEAEPEPEDDDGEAVEPKRRKL
jgi:hypothetical protein